MRVLLVDDHSLFRRGLRLMLAELLPDVVVEDAESCESAARFADQMFDIVLLDLHMPGTQGLSALNAIRELFPLCAAVVLSGDESPQIIRDALSQGAAGFIPKAAEPEVMIAALKIVLSNGVYVPHQALQAASGSLSGLTERQAQILQLALRGTPNKLIAREMGVAEGTVKSHLSTIFRALNVRNRTEALYCAAKLGLKI